MRQNLVWSAWCWCRRSQWWHQPQHLAQWSDTLPLTDLKTNDPETESQMHDDMHSTHTQQRSCRSADTTQHYHMQFSADVHRPQLHSTDHSDLVVPRANTDRFGRHGFPVSGSNQWHKLPPDIRKVSDKPEQFARALKTYFISKQHWQALLRITSKGGL